MSDFFKENMICFIVIIWNFFVFLLYGIDKRKAKRGRWRISEKALLLSSACFGSVGALLGMRIFHHKTKHTVFRIGIPFLLMIHVFLIIIILYK